MGESLLGPKEFLANLKSEVMWQHFASAFIPLLAVQIPEGCSNITAIKVIPLL